MGCCKHGVSAVDPIGPRSVSLPQLAPALFPFCHLHSQNGFDSGPQIHWNFHSRNKGNLVTANRSNVNSKTKSEKKKKKEKKNNWQKQIKAWNDPCDWQSFMGLTIIHVIHNHLEFELDQIQNCPEVQNFSFNNLTLPCLWNKVKVKVTKYKNGVQDKLQQAGCCHRNGDG